MHYPMESYMSSSTSAGSKTPYIVFITIKDDGVGEGE